MNRIVTSYFVGTGCIRAEEPIAFDEKGSCHATIRQCRPSKIHCRIHEFYFDNVEKLKLLRDAIQKPNKPSTELSNTLSVIDRATEDPTCLCDDRVCSKIGDAIAAVDGQQMDHFAANNDREWRLLAAVFGKPLLNPVRDGATAEAEVP